VTEAIEWFGTGQNEPMNQPTDQPAQQAPKLQTNHSDDNNGEYHLSRPQQQLPSQESTTTTATTTTTTATTATTATATAIAIDGALTTNERMNE